jgi:hypothetical protein
MRPRIPVKVTFHTTGERSEEAEVRRKTESSPAVDVLILTPES